MKRFLSIMVTVGVVCILCGDATAGRTTVELKSADVSVQESAEAAQGAYFLMNVDVPDGITSTTLLGAILEFYLDVDSRADTVTVAERDTSYAVVHWNPVPLLEVYALNAPTGSALDSERWNQEMSFPVPVAAGSNKIVRIDITQLVNYLLEHPEQNYGLVIGSLSGRRDGMFSLRESFGAGVFARVRYVH